MKIAATQYTLNHRSLEVYVAGCRGPHCPGCHNPELFSFDVGDDYREVAAKVVETAKSSGAMVNKIWVLGGEPLDQDLGELTSLLDMLAKAELPIWLFTRYELSAVPEEVKKRVDFLKCGRYDANFLGNKVEYGVTLSSTNQTIHKLK